MLIRITSLISAVATVVCVVVLGLGSAPAAHAAAAPPRVSFVAPQWWAADDTVHQIRYDIPCPPAETAQHKQCWVVITLSATTSRIAAPGSSSAALLAPNISPYNQGTKTITNDFKTCTGWFGSCGDYTDAQLQSNVSYDSVQGFVHVNWQHQFCSAYGWNCVTPLGGTSAHDSGDQAHTTTLEYGPQLYHSTHNDNQQTKWVQTVVNKYGDYHFSNSCSGALC